MPAERWPDDGAEHAGAACALRRRARARHGDCRKGCRRPERAGRPRIPAAIGRCAGTGEAANGARLLRAAARFRRIFELSAPGRARADLLRSRSRPVERRRIQHRLRDRGCLRRRPVAPHCIPVMRRRGGRISVAVRSRTRTRSRPAETQRPQSATLRRYIDALLPYRVESMRDIGWVSAMRIADGERCLLPADICLRRGHDRRAIAPPLHARNRLRRRADIRGRRIAWPARADRARCRQPVVARRPPRPCGRAGKRCRTACREAARADPARR